MCQTLPNNLFIPEYPSCFLVNRTAATDGPVPPNHLRILHITVHGWFGVTSLYVISNPGNQRIQLNMNVRRKNCHKCWFAKLDLLFSIIHHCLVLHLQGYPLTSQWGLLTVFLKPEAQAQVKMRGGSSISVKLPCQW